jgi:hypothetical protein
MWTTKNAEPGLWAVGFTSPSGGWHTDSDFHSLENAEKQAA